MAAKSIIDIDVQDEKFQSFLDKFNEYQKALSELPEQWRGAVHGLGDAAKETERVKTGTESITQAFTEGVAAIASLNDGLDRLNGHLDKANKTQSELNKKSSAGRNFLNKASKDAKSLAGHLKDATSSILSWGTVLGIFSGLAGAGGLWGINRLAGNASAQRFTAMGLGTTAGGLNSAAVNYQKALGNPVATLGAIRDSQLDLSKRWQFQAMGINNPNQDPATLLPQMIRSARDIFVKNGSTQQGAEAYGLTNYFTLDDLNRFKNMSDAEIDAMVKQAQKDTQRLQLTDEQLKQWQDFNIQLDRSKIGIENTFIRGLAPLTPALGKLSDAFSGAIDTVLKSPELGKWIDGLSDGIRRFGNYLAAPEFKSDVESFMSGIERLWRLIGKVIDWVAGKTNISLDDVKAGSSMLRKDPEAQYGSSGLDKRSWFSGIADKMADDLNESRRWSNEMKSKKYDPIFEEAAKKYNLDPKVLKATAGAESSWNPNAEGPVTRSGKRAQGLMQVMPDNFQPGENPFDPRDNIMAGARVMAWAKKQAGGDVDEMLRWYNGGSRRGSKENREYAGRVNEQYRNIYGADMPGTSQSVPAMQPAQSSSNKTDQLLQQLVDDGKRRGVGGGLVVYNNTGGSAIVGSTQLGGYG
ncbi:lytic transglycosylase domain-containing protein [Cedecea sp. FDAARGOS_727]|uniref:lytic transglycosylase domain-containing protein n=1 Tax=Cedecea sp. FDAARGOS_727 TaxID=2545798 RepID=UPI00143EA101|nr:lytic transglycosylase domain-containing protein [Cedecea sp. FDAARGOS_727]QIX97459.1 lytic transglycosylase domain-containing protein [Cedecea sp. FDAARGOS_727]